jgi:hypothetical protein
MASLFVWFGAIGTRTDFENVNPTRVVAREARQVVYCFEVIFEMNLGGWLQPYLFHGLRSTGLVACHVWRVALS